MYRNKTFLLKKHSAWGYAQLPGYQEHPELFVSRGKASKQDFTREG